MKDNCEVVIAQATGGAAFTKTYSFTSIFEEV